MEGASRRRAAPGSQFVEFFGIEALGPVGRLVGSRNSASQLPLTGRVFYAGLRKTTLTSIQPSRTKVRSNPSFEPTPNSVAPPAGPARCAQFAVPARGATLSVAAQFKR